MNAPHILSEARAVEYLRAQLKAEHQLSDGDDVLEDTLDGATNLDEAVEAIRIRLFEKKATVEKLRSMEDSLESRRKRVEASIASDRALLTEALSIAGKKSVRTTLGTVTLIAGKPSVEVTEKAENIPDEYRTAKMTYAPNKDAIKAALESGKSLSFAYIANGSPTVQVR